MADLELTRQKGDRRLYSLEGIGTLRTQGFFSRAAIAKADARSWRFAPRGLFGRRVEANDAGGELVGEFEPRTFRRGGIVRWGGRELVLRPASSWKERYALVDGDRELALFDGKRWGRRPVKVTLGEGETFDPGLVLFAVFLIRRFAQDADSAAAGGSTAAVGGGT